MGTGEFGYAAVETVEAGGRGDVDLSREGPRQCTLNKKSAGIGSDHMYNERVRVDKNCPQVVGLNL